MSRQCRVLLVEDEPLITLFYEDVLRGSEFYLVASVDCNRDALSKVDDLDIDMVIVDYNLKDGSCLPLIKRLKELGIQFIIATGYGYNQQEDVIGVPWLTKPFTEDKLLHAIRGLVR